MANLTVRLYVRIKTEDGKKPFCKPVYLSKGRLKPLYALVDGQKLASAMGRCWRVIKAEQE